MREERAALVREDAVIARLGLGVGRQVRAQRQALDRAWERGQLIREETRQPPLKLVWLGKRDRYG